MHDKLTLPVFGALVLAAAGLGAHLGESAIDQIDPIHFQGPAVHPRDRGAALPAGLDRQSVPFADHYGWEEGQGARSADCGGCDSLAARDRYAEGRVGLALIETGWEPAPRAAEHSEPDLEEGSLEAAEAFALQWAEVDRYASFPVEEDVPAQDPPAEE